MASDAVREDLIDQVGGAPRKRRRRRRKPGGGGEGGAPRPGGDTGAP
jgi:hypothetical protein